MTRTTDSNKHFTKDYSTTGLDASQVDAWQTERSVKGSEAATHASVVAPPQRTRSENCANSKERPRRKTSSSTTEVQPLAAKLRLKKNDKMLHIPLQYKH